ncbi:hypothetical protein C8T65DRAFT_652568 [Cerioporus squamosus]|nr:hypothetical protein C8T65DRAFT_652568 [Cerioporus squamosus]
MGWNPEENYIMIEPNVKYLLSSPRAARYAPIPWYKRPPPRPVQPGPPQDKLRYVSTRRIQNAFQHNTPFRQTVADDLDSLMQTFLNALLKRTGYMPCMLSHYGKEELHPLKVAREEASDHFWYAMEDQRRLREAQERARKAKEGGSAGEEVDAKTGEDIEPGPEGVAAMVEPLWEMMKMSTTMMASENRVAREWGRQEPKEQKDQRAAEHYEKFTEVMQKVLEAADVGEKRTLLRKALVKAEREKRIEQARAEARKPAETRKLKEVSETEDTMDIDEEGSTDTVPESGVADGEDETDMAAEADETKDQVDLASPPSPQPDGTQEPPKKRARLE